jgi:hypothetical protein
MVFKQKGGAAMVRTQVYLTENQRNELARIAQALGKKQSEIIREGIDLVIERSRRNCRENALREAAGMWKDRTDLPDFEKMRKEWDRL